MAERRMFAIKIIDSDAFLDMPLSTQALYFHLSMRADDEGFISNPKKIMRMIGANPNEMDLLLAKNYILGFESGVVVVKHWHVHNYIRKDRFNPTLFTDEKSQISQENNKTYKENVVFPIAVTDGRPMVDHEEVESEEESYQTIPSETDTSGENVAFSVVETDGSPLVDQERTQVRIGKVRLGKDNIYCPSDDEPQKSEKELVRDCFENLWSLYPNKKGKSQVKATQRKYLYKHADDIEGAIKNYIQDVESQRANGFQDLNWLHGSTFFNGRYEDYLPGNYVPTQAKAVPSQKANNSVNNYMQRDYSNMTEEEFEAMHRCDVRKGVQS